MFTFNGSETAANELVESVKKNANSSDRVVEAVRVDVCDAAALSQAITEAGKKHGKLDILVNNAGVLLLGPVESFSLEDFDKTVAVNVRAAFVATKAAVALMPQNGGGGGGGGRVINIGSCNGERIPFPGASAYAMSKAALQGLTQGLARDLGPRGITVNNVQPGPTHTDMNPDKTPFADMLHKVMALPRHAQADEIAAMVAYLAGPEAGFVTGANLLIDGGFCA